MWTRDKGEGWREKIFLGGPDLARWGIEKTLPEEEILSKRDLTHEKDSKQGRFFEDGFERSWEQPLADSQQRNGDLSPTAANDKILPQPCYLSRGVQVPDDHMDSPHLDFNLVRFSVKKSAILYKTFDLQNCELINLCYCKLLCNSSHGSREWKCTIKK